MRAGILPTLGVCRVVEHFSVFMLDKFKACPVHGHAQVASGFMQAQSGNGRSASEWFSRPLLLCTSLI